MKTVIIAAGRGSRIRNKSDDIPKTLLPYGEGTILSTILKHFELVGAGDFIIVVGYQSKCIENYLKNNSHFGYNIIFVENNDWKKGNGISVLVSEAGIAGEDFILSMSDHIVSPKAMKRIVEYDSNKNLLLVDPQTDRTFDIDDATRVLYEKSQIIDIGKKIEQYNGIDCGIFKLNSRFFEAMRKALKKKQDSISAAIRILINDHDMEAVFLEQDDQWIDIDTPRAYKHCMDNIKLEIIRRPTIFHNP